ncbi:MAG: CapA family protein [Lachnospiraceae bacterium]|nr:CapA family protein [Lachnospiraceae bacterium]
MSRTKLRADNAEQLAEIIKAIQRGEEPTQESIRRNTESAPLADSPMSGSEKGDTDSTGSEKDGDTGFAVRWPSVQNAKSDLEETQPQKKAERSEQPDRPARIEQPEEEPQNEEEDEEEDWEGFSPKEFVQDVTARAQGVLGFFKRRKEPAGEKADTADRLSRSDSGLEKQTESGSKTSAENDSAAVMEDETGKKAGNDWKETTAQRDWPEPGEDSWEEDESDSGLLGRKRVRLTDTMEENERFRPSKWGTRKPSKTETAETEKQPESESTEKSEDEAEKSAEKSEDGPEDFNQRQKLEKLMESGRNAEMKEIPEIPETEGTIADGNLPDKMQKRKIGSLQKSEQEPEEGQEETAEERKKRTPSEKNGSVKRSGMNFKDRLREHGIGGREIGMLVIGVILAVLIVILIGKTIAGMIADSKRSENVTADKGLRVLVEEEPASWSNTYPVKLKFKVSGAAITEIRVNGTACTADDQGIVTYEADSGELEAEVDTDKSQTLKASIEIPMLDGEAPVVHAVRKQDQIELTASDTRSTVTGIYYAAVDDTAIMDLPEYQKYSRPITYAENTMYYFYAEDAAGNCSVPIATNMETATKLVLEQENIHLYPGGSTELMAEAEPSGALLDNLQYESLNPEILSVSKSGTVTALGEGTGSIKVSADGVEDVVCTVTVSDTKTITVSTLGDCTLGTDANFSTANSFNAYDEANGHDYFFKNVKSILEEDDVTFANLEGTFTTSNDRQDKQYAFKGDPDYTEILTDGSVEVVTLANNHSGDYGEQGLADTETALEEAGIDYCIGDTITVKEVNGVKIAFIGIFVNYGTDDSENQLRSDIENAKKQGAELIITAFHWGSEKATQPDETQQSLAHIAIDCGADLVVGHHPHVLQGIEKYNGKYIAYSLGNFCFGGNSNPSDMDTMIFRQTFTISGDGAAEDDDVTVIPCSISSDQGYNNYQPTPAEGEAAASIIARLNEYSAAYGVTVADDGSVSSGTAGAA